ncbi:ArsR/SmtB family transcription factor [Qaidamihabitans albus]|uniref:ArsR/SmtB family transcription factor n=1 Tax=Qaidamihabitans albus TaxID=2795733 RepID=UPI003557C05B
MQPSIYVDNEEHDERRSAVRSSCPTRTPPRLRRVVRLPEPARVRTPHAVATDPGGITVGALTEQLGISQSACSHHIRKLADIGFLRRARRCVLHGLVARGCGSPVRVARAVATSVMSALT